MNRFRSLSVRPLPRARDPKTKRAVAPQAGAQTSEMHFRITRAPSRLPYIICSFTSPDQLLADFFAEVRKAGGES
jgi:hypothetical protein